MWPKSGENPGLCAMGQSWLPSASCHVPWMAPTTGPWVAALPTYHLEHRGGLQKHAHLPGRA